MRIKPSPGVPPGEWFTSDKEFYLKEGDAYKTW